jgi:hypothetical protein
MQVFVYDSFMAVVNLREHAEENEPMVWMCDCGNCSFTIFASGAVECAECNTPQTVDAHYQAVARWTRKARD